MMIRLVAVISVCLGVAASLDMVSVGRINFNYGTSTLKSEFARRKRDAGDESTSIPLDGIGGDDDCISKCANEMDISMSALDQKANANLGKGLTLDTSTIDTSDLRDTCAAYKQGRSCLDACPASDIKDMILSAFAGLDFMCISHYDELVADLPCFNKSGDEITKTCDPQCGLTDDGLSALQDNTKDLATQGDIDGMTKVIAKLCGMISCQLSCENPIIMRVCNDAGAAQFQSKFVSEAFKPLQQMLTSLGMDQYWPTECRVLTKNEN